MKILTKITIPVLLLLLGGCAHYDGYHSGYSNTGSYGVSVSRYTPHYSYPFYYDHDYYGHNPFAYKHYGHKTYRDKYNHDFDSHRKHYRNNKHWQHSNKKRSGHYAGKHLSKNYYPESHYRKHKPSKHLHSDRSGYIGKHRRREHDDRNSQKYHRQQR